MAIRECPNANETCPLYGERPIIRGSENGCYSDLDHRVPKRLAHTALERLFIVSPVNKQQLCRAEHEEKTARGDEPIPSREVMLASIMAQIASGELVVRSKKMSRLIEQGEL